MTRRVLKRADLIDLGLERKWSAARQAREEIAQLKALVEQIDQEIKNAVGDAEEITLNGVPVALYQYKKAYAWSQFAAENEILAKQYTTQVTREELDKDALIAKHSSALAPYQTREYRMVSGTEVRRG